MPKVLSVEELRERLASGDCKIEAGELVDLSKISADEVAVCKFDVKSGFVVAEEKKRKKKREKRSKESKEQRASKEAQPQERQEPLVVAEAVEVVAEPPEEQSVENTPPSVVPAVAAVAVPQQAESVALTTTPPVQETKAVVEQPIPHLADLKGIMPADGNANVITVMLAGVAVLGGGTAWKFYQNLSKQKHEENMARIEKESERKDDQHQQCNASRAALELKVTGLESTISELRAAMEKVKAEQVEQEKKLAEQAKAVQAPAISSDDLEDLKEKLEQLEKALKPKRAKKEKAV